MSGWCGQWHRMAGWPILVAGLTAVSAPAAAQTPDPSASATGSMSAASAAPMATTVDIALSDFDIAPDVIEVPDAAVAFMVTNTGITPHNFSIRDEGGTLVGATSEIGQDGSAELGVALPGSGTYTFFCSLPGHESLGMTGTLVVTEVAMEPSPVP